MEEKSEHFQEVSEPHLTHHHHPHTHAAIRYNHFITASALLNPIYPPGHKSCRVLEQSPGFKLQEMLHPSNECPDSVIV